MINLILSYSKLPCDQESPLQCPLLCQSKRSDVLRGLLLCQERRVWWGGAPRFPVPVYLVAVLPWHPLHGDTWIWGISHPFLCTQMLSPSFLWLTAWAHPDRLGGGNVAPSHPRTTPSGLPPASCFQARALHLGNFQVLLTSQVTGDDTRPLAPKKEEANCKAWYSVAYKKAVTIKPCPKYPENDPWGGKGGILPWEMPFCAARGGASRKEYKENASEWGQPSKTKQKPSYIHRAARLAGGEMGWSACPPPYIDLIFPSCQ